MQLCCIARVRGHALHTLHVHQAMHGEGRLAEGLPDLSTILSALALPGCKVGEPEVALQPALLIQALTMPSLPWSISATIRMAVMAPAARKIWQNLYQMHGFRQHTPACLQLAGARWLHCFASLKCLALSAWNEVLHGPVDRC